MTENELFSHIDATLLKPYATWEEIVEHCEKAMEFGVATVCIPPCYVRRVKQKYGRKLPITTVVGFPFGYSVLEAKLEETKKAIEDGADEIDMVINLSDVKNKDYDKIMQEIVTLKLECNTKLLKVIVETCDLTKEEKKELCRIVTDAGADFIKTSTGFGKAGANLSDIDLFKEHLGAAVRIKAAGDIKSREEMEKFLSAGCERIGVTLKGEWMKSL